MGSGLGRGQSKDNENIEGSTDCRSLWAEDLLEQKNKRNELEKLEVVLREVNCLNWVMGMSDCYLS